MSDAASTIAPKWEKLYPGRYKAEIDALKSVGDKLEIDRQALAAGRLSVTFDWPLSSGQVVRLTAHYPDSFPHLRPHVLLKAGLNPRPIRHMAPMDGNICLLGRDPRQWMPGDTLAGVLSTQLEDALTGEGDEDPQGEPAEYWWNGLNVSGSFVLIDSSWDLGGAESGTLLLSCIADEVHHESPDGGEIDEPRVRGYIARVKDADGTPLCEWCGPLPEELRSTPKSVWIPWVRLDEPFLPKPPLDQQIQDLLQSRRWLADQGKIVTCSRNISVQPLCTVFPSELSFGAVGTGWAFPFIYGSPKAIDKKKLKNTGRKNKYVSALPVYRAGPTDIAFRAPAAQGLRDKRILLVGCGAIGAPLAVELTRNGLGELHLVDHDFVEPGNSVRWPLGTSAWGKSKVESLQEFIRREYPATKVHAHRHAFGSPIPSDRPGDQDILDTFANHVDLIIDASTNYGVTTYLHSWAVLTGIPLIGFFATPSIGGGIVARYSPGDGCPNCLEWAWETREIPCPKGWEGEGALIQPPGCSERTFTGANYELGELSLQAMRLVVETLEPDSERVSIVQTLQMIDGNGRRCAPIWSTSRLARHPNCPCSNSDAQ